MKGFGTYLKSLRMPKGLTVQELADLVGLSHSYLSEIENDKKGKLSPELIEKLSEVLKTPYEDLMLKAGYVPKEVVLQMIANDAFEQYKRGELVKIREVPIDGEPDKTRLDFMDALKQSDCTYNGHKLNDSEKKRIETVLRAVLPEKFAN